MSAPEVHHLFHNPIADHSFSADRQTLAIARDTTVELYGRVGNSFKLKDELKGHDKTVTSIDIAPNSGRIVTCSQGKLLDHLRQQLQLTSHAQIAMPSCGSLPPKAISRPSSSCASTELPPLYAGRRTRPSLRLDLVTD